MPPPTAGRPRAPRTVDEFVRFFGAQQYNSPPGMEDDEDADVANGTNGPFRSLSFTQDTDGTTRLRVNMPANQIPREAVEQADDIADRLMEASGASEVNPQVEPVVARPSTAVEEMMRHFAPLFDADGNTRPRTATQVDQDVRAQMAIEARARAQIVEAARNDAMRAEFNAMFLPSQRQVQSAPAVQKPRYTIITDTGAQFVIELKHFAPCWRTTGESDLTLSGIIISPAGPPGPAAPLVHEPESRRIEVGD